MCILDGRRPLIMGPHLGRKWAICWFSVPLNMFKSSIPKIWWIEDVNPWRVGLCDHWSNLYVFILLTHPFPHHICNICCGNGIEALIGVANVLNAGVDPTTPILQCRRGIIASIVSLVLHLEEMCLLNFLLAEEGISLSYSVLRVVLL